MTTHGRQPNVGKGTSSPAVPRQTRVPASSTQPKTSSSKLTSSSTSLSRNPRPTSSTSPSLSRGRSFDNKSSPSNAPLQKSQSSITRTRTTPVVPRSHVEKPLVKSQTRSSSMNHRQGIGTVLNKKPANSNVVVTRKVKSVGTAKAPPVIAEDIDQVVEEGSTVTVDSDHDHDDEEQQGIREEEEQEHQTDREEEEEVIDEETSTQLQMGEEKEEQINMNEEDQSENKIETSPIDDLPTTDVEEQINSSMETIDEPIKTETNADPPMGEEEQTKIDEDDDHPVEEDQVQDDPIKENEGEIETVINPEETVEAQENQNQELEPQQGGGGEKFLKATEIMKLMEAQTSGKDLTSASPRTIVRGSSGINRGSSFNKKEAAAAADYNDVIEETASKLQSEKRRNKVLALAGAFETVISLHQD